MTPISRTTPSCVVGLFLRGSTSDVKNVKVDRITYCTMFHPVIPEVPSVTERILY
jgi:hypothetical protein